MRAVSIIGMILSILIIIGSFVAMAVAYASYKSEVYNDFGEFGGMIRHMDYQPYIIGVIFGFVLLIGSIIGMSASRKRPQPIVNVYNQQPQMQQQPIANYSPVNNNPQNYQQIPNQQTVASVDNLINQAVQSYNAKDYNNAIAILSRALAVTPTHNIVHFNLACLYSLTNQKSESFASLGKAVEYGYVNFEKIRTVADLQWIRSQAEYSEFVRHGYKFAPAVNSANAKSDIISKTQDSGNGDIIEKIERLGKLKEQGHITEAEFDEQKKKLLA